jgi:prepilin-type processing-associated H-X9-DG protein
MGTLRRRPVPLATDEQIIRALAGVATRSSPRFQRFHHAGKSYIAFEGGVPPFRAGTLVATGYAVSLMADGHVATPDELSAALDALERRPQGQRG